MFRAHNTGIFCIIVKKVEHTGNEYIHYWPSDAIDASALRVGPEGV
jgi:hypothetical protein